MLRGAPGLTEPLLLLPDRVRRLLLLLTLVLGCGRPSPTPAVSAPTTTVAAADPFAPTPTAALAPALPTPQTGWRFALGDDPHRAEPGFDDRRWTPVAVPGAWDAGRGLAGTDGIGWYRTRVVLPDSLRRQTLTWVMGRVADADETFINGQRIGSTGLFPPASRPDPAERRYLVPPDALGRDSVVTIAVRVWNESGPGGIVAGPVGFYTERSLRRLGGEQAADPSDEVKTAIERTIRAMDSYLSAGRIDPLMTLIDDGYANNGVIKDEQKTYYQSIQPRVFGGTFRYSPLTFFGLNDSTVEVVYTNTLVAPDGKEIYTGDERRTFTRRSGSRLWRELGNRDRFFTSVINSLFYRPLGRVPYEPQPYQIYLPPTYYDDPTVRFPTIYLLRDGKYADVSALPARLDSLMRRGGPVPPAVIVLPGPGPKLYADAETDTSRRYEAYFLRELVTIIDRDVRTLPDRTARGIAGLGDGGFGALSLGLRHPRLFAAVAAHDPTLPAPGAAPAAGFSPEVWRRTNPLSLATDAPMEPLNGYALLWLSRPSGSASLGFAALDAQLKSRTVPHTATVAVGDPFVALIRAEAAALKRAAPGAN